MRLHCVCKHMSISCSADSALAGACGLGRMEDEEGPATSGGDSCSVASWRRSKGRAASLSCLSSPSRDKRISPAVMLSSPHDSSGRASCRSSRSSAMVTPSASLYVPTASSCSRHTKLQEDCTKDTLHQTALQVDHPERGFNSSTPQESQVLHLLHLVLLS